MRHALRHGQRGPCLQGTQPSRRRPQSMGLPMPVHAATGRRGSRPAAALIHSRRNVPHSISPLFGTLRPSPRRAISSGAVALGHMRFREQPRRLERLARALAVSLIVVWVTVAAGCGASEKAPPNPPSPHVAQPGEDVTPCPYPRSCKVLRFGGGGSDDRRAARDADTARANANANANALGNNLGNARAREPGGCAGSRSEPHPDRRSREGGAARARQGGPTRRNRGR